MAVKRTKREQEQEDKMAKDLECFLNQPNINMVIPWIYGIYKSVRDGGGSGGGGSGGGGGGGGGSEVIIKEMEWEVEGD